VETTSGEYFKRVFGVLKKNGFLLESDAKLPSVCTLITGEALHGSWWSHPLAQVIFHVNEQLEDHNDVLITKLISGKVTFVHRKLWSGLFAVARTREPWQMKGLSGSARSLLQMIDEQGSLRTDRISWPKSDKTKPGAVARELEKKLLIHGEQFHSESGAHAKLLETWEHWAKRKGFEASVITAEQAKTTIEESLRKLNKEFQAAAKAAWQ
jgi:hypothetical protein